MADSNSQPNTGTILELPAFPDLPFHLSNMDESVLQQIRQDIFQILQDCVKPTSPISPASAGRMLRRLWLRIHKKNLEGSQTTKTELGGTFMFTAYRLFFEVAKQISHLPGQCGPRDRLLQLVHCFQRWYSVYPGKNDERYFNFVDSRPVEVYLEPVGEQERLQRLRAHTFAAILTRDSIIDHTVFATKILDLAIEIPPHRYSSERPVNHRAREALVELASQWIRICGDKLLSTQTPEVWSMWKHRSASLTTFKPLEEVMVTTPFLRECDLSERSRQLLWGIYEMMQEIEEKRKERLKQEEAEKRHEERVRKYEALPNEVKREMWQKAKEKRDREEREWHEELDKARRGNEEWERCARIDRIRGKLLGTTLFELKDDEEREDCLRIDRVRGRLPGPTYSERKFRQAFEMAEAE
ncbi:uncharacterized protein PAC_17052 [Phialocephala subalpina]|uniref:Uncharacterized protein n=1 Tax=Phialocephala subalpina TaxID=576137 RepID=A0A1L7XQ43_9HELO|nr:uncharacterized protein PAC_17052 [Phialocephala subalpina]